MVFSMSPFSLPALAGVAQWIESLQPPGSFVSVSHHLWIPEGLTKLLSGVLASKVKVGHLPHL